MPAFKAKGIIIICKNLLALFGFKFTLDKFILPVLSIVNSYTNHTFEEGKFHLGLVEAEEVLVQVYFDALIQLVFEHIDFKTFIY